MANGISKVTKEAVRQGWRTKAVKGGTMYLSPNGVDKVTVHGTPSDRRTLDNLIGEFRRGGLIWPPPTKKG